MDWISIDKALTELAVRKQTLYAYVSRGLVRAKADESDPRRSLYSASDVGKLKGRRRGARRRSEVAAGAIAWGEPVLESAISTVLSLIHIWSMRSATPPLNSRRWLQRRSPPHAARSRIAMSLWSGSILRVGSISWPTCAAGPTCRQSSLLRAGRRTADRWSTFSCSPNFAARPSRFPSRSTALNLRLPPSNWCVRAPDQARWRLSPGTSSAASTGSVRPPRSLRPPALDRSTLAAPTARSPAVRGHARSIPSRGRNRTGR